MRGPQNAADADLFCNPDSYRVAGFCQRETERYRSLELAVVVGNGLPARLVAVRDADWLIGNDRFESKGTMQKGRKIHDRLHRRTWLSFRLRNAIEVAVVIETPVKHSTAAHFREDAGVTVLKNDDGALNDSGSTGMALFVHSQAMLQCLGCDSL